MSFTVVIPTYNAGDIWSEVIGALQGQSINPDKIIVVDSSSTDNTVELARAAGFETHTIDKKDFDHGGTRSFALGFVVTGIVVFLTQDAILNDARAVENLLGAFDNDDVGAAFGRQLPHKNANPLAIYARNNSYGCEGYLTDLKSSYPSGFRKAFLSNSFAAYRCSVLRRFGGFPSKLILGEDSYIAAKVLLSGGSVAYVADALVRHSHNYSILEEFKRYFDIGVFHETQKWMLEELGSVEGEGVKFALGQIRFLMSRSEYYYVLVSLLASLAKFIGYRMGRNYHVFSVKQCRNFSMYKSYWNR
ncbi:glycosyltransferase family 2 protein [Zhongshania arctica]|uniref:Glycosyltransferase family 2 protein n=1 Tax=Zhongshania arctica TaxID=3238302 RepID=A0ABV3TSC1_9GAMM